MHLQARERHLQICASLLLWQRMSVQRSLDQCPQLLHMTPQDLSLRLASIKACRQLASHSIPPLGPVIAFFPRLNLCWQSPR